MNSFIGQFHPLIVHLPIGILLVGLYFKIWSTYIGSTKYQDLIPQIVFLAWISAIAATISGYLLSLGSGYEEELLNNHKWAGIFLMIIVGGLYLLLRKKSTAMVQNGAWLVATVLLVITGHLGGTLTHGEGYLSFGSPAYTKPIIDTIEEAIVYRDVIEPILAQKCWSCHSSSKQRGGLRLDDVKYVLKGGKHGPIIAGSSEGSKMYKRLNLPEDDDEHMPPAGRPQPTESEIKLIAWWINNDAPYDKKIKEVSTSPEIYSILEELVVGRLAVESYSIPQLPIPPADSDTIKTVQSFGIHVLPVAQNSNYLQVNLNRKTILPSQWNVLRQIGKNLVWLNASYLTISDTAVRTISSFEHLIKLDLSHVLFQDKSLQFLNAFPNLSTLNLSHTDCTIQNLRGLRPLDKLKNLYIFNSKISTDSIEVLKSIFPNATIDKGHYVVPTFHGDTTELTYEEFKKTKKTKADSLAKITK